MAPTEYWLKEEIIKDNHTLDLPVGFSRSECLPHVGLYEAETGERLPALVGGQRVENDAVPLTAHQ